MKKTNDWNPELYLKFRDERTRPSLDLVSRINLDNPATAVDIGCGPGNSTQVITARWPECRVTGIDNSPAMIEKAKKDFPDQQWITADAIDLDTSVKYDLVFSNATIQWIPGHENLLKTMWNMVNTNGALAVQVPLYNLMPVCSAVEEAAQSRWSRLASGVMGIFTFHEPGFYHEILSGFTGNIELWVTDYYHVMDSHASIVEMVRSTGMKPYLERMENETDRYDFEAAVLHRIKDAYPQQNNGSVLFPFKRLFFTGYK